MAENVHPPLTWHIALTTVYALTCYTVMMIAHCFRAFGRIKVLSLFKLSCFGLNAAVETLAPLFAGNNINSMLHLDSQVQSDFALAHQCFVFSSTLNAALWRKL